MKNRLRNTIALLLLPQIGFVIWLRTNPEMVETWYSKGLYPYIAQVLRSMYGWIPFSVGDCLYALLTLFVLRYLWVHWNKIKHSPMEFLRNVLVVLSVAYFSFHLLWGFNYYRLPLKTSMRLDDNYSQQELIALSRQLISKTNSYQRLLSKDSTQAVVVPYDRAEISAKTVAGYATLKNRFPFLDYKQTSLKESLFSTMLSYMGYGGYLNPFTNEAQVNAKIPLFRFPVICGHEIGHQLGYSAENETNFIGYLVTAGNKDPYFQYASYAYAASYCLSEINRKDPETFEELYAGFNPGVKENYKELKQFWENYENPLEPVFKSIFNSFLKANNQAEGLKSYNRIVGLLVSYHRKNPV